MRYHCRMSQNTKGKGKKTSKDSNLEPSNIGDKLNKKFRLSFRGNKSKKEKNKMTKADDDEECASHNILGDYNKDNLGNYPYLCNNNSNFDPKIDCQRDFTCDNEVIRKNEQNISDSRGGNNTQTIREDDSEVIDETLDFITGILHEILSAVVIDDNNSENSDSAFGDADETDSMCKEIIGRRKPSNPDEKKIKSAHRKTCIADDVVPNPNFKMRETSRRDSLYSVEEFDEELDENENHNKSAVQAINQVLVNQIASNNFVNQHPKVKKKNSFFNSLFGKGKKDKKTDSTKSKGLQASRKYNSTFELSQRLLEKSPSFIRKSVRHVMNKDVPNLLKRSFSVRDAERKKDKQLSRGKLTEMKNLEWARSLQSLVENDNSVSYDDMSFINYDTLNTVTYDRPRPALNLHRTQSLIVHGSPGRNFSRGSSVLTHYQSAIDISEQSEALSLPSLQYAIRENEESVYDGSPATRYRRRPQSVSSEDGKVRPRANGSFRSAGSGCAKLKRTNACRQKSRDSLPLFVEQRNSQTVRSRSLNHLDTLEMRYGVQCASDTTLKDSRSEPDCTRPLLAPPAPNIEPPSPTSDAPISRRHVLSRSQKSSSECFSVNFEVGDESTWENELFYPAMRGVTLLDALANQSELRSIDLNNCDAWLQDRESNTNTLITFSQDTANLVGRHIRITAKDHSNKRSALNHSKKFSGSYKPKAPSFFSSSTEESTATPNWPQDSTRLSSQDADSIKKQGKQRWSGFFSNNKDTRMEQLTELLNNYTIHGVPSSQIYPQGQVESLDALYKLEGDWREIINYKELPERQQQQQTALWELIKTEVAYIKTLKVVTDLFLACLKNLQTESLLKEIDTEKLFSNITEILDTNVLFWRNSLFPMVRDMRKYRQPPCIETMLQGFLNMKDSFRAYFRYCAEQARCQHYCRENLHNESFAAYLAWCETQKECNRLRLMDILVQPMQRLTKYGLLLKAILKNTDEEVERDSLEHMIKSVDDFVNNVNSSLKQRQDTERLKGLIVRIESYDIVESKDDDLEKLLRSYSALDLNRPMMNCPPDRKRHLLLEGDLKLKDSNTSKMEVHCFLLTDILLVCKPSTKKGVATMRVIRQPYLVDRLDVTDLNKETPTLALIYKNEFNMPVAAFILQNNDAKKLKSWKESIAKAQSLYAQAKQPTYLEESLDADYGLVGDSLESDFHSLQLAPRSPLASSSRASRVSSLAHSHSGSVEMNDQSSLGSGKDHSRAVSVENENRTASISSDEGVQPLPPDRSPVSQKNSFKTRVFGKTPNTLSVQPYTNLGQSLPNLALGSPNVGTLSLNLNQNTLSVPNTKNGGHLLSPTHRGISYPPPSPTRGNLRRGLAISQNKNPPLLKTRHVNSTTASTSGQVPASLDFDVPVIAGVSPTEQCENFSRGQLRQAMVKRGHRNENKRYHTAGVVDDIKRNDNRDANIHKRLSLNYNSQEATLPPPPTSQEET